MVLRIITGVIGIFLLAFVINTGGWPFVATFGLLAIFAWHEYTHALYSRNIAASYCTGVFSIGLLAVVAYLQPSLLLAVFMGTVLLIFAETVILHRNFNFDEAAASVAGVAYIGLPFAHLIMLRFIEQGLTFSAGTWGSLSFGVLFVWIMFIGTWASDTFAYFVGSAFGKHKLAFSISPNKTVEGFIGSLVGSALALSLVGKLFSLNLYQMVTLGIMLAVLSTLGDLVESVFKRHVRIKDSGNLIPGHGGVLDRFDSMLFTAPFMYYYALFFNYLITR